jgi:hypothetical protein
MIRELQIIFGHHPIALHLGIARERLVFLVKLARVSARAVVDPIAPIGAVISTIGPGRTAPAATTATVLTIVYQLFAAFVTGGKWSPLPKAGPIPAKYMHDSQGGGFSRRRTANPLPPMQNRQISAERPLGVGWGPIASASKPPVPAAYLVAHQAKSKGKFGVVISRQV